MRVFVTVGTALDPFDRMLRMVDEALPREGVTGVCQYGSSTVVPRGLEGRERLSRAEFERELRESDVVICHAGVGSIRAAMDAGHRPIVMARSPAHEEIVNAHQPEICAELSRARHVTWVRDAGELSAALRAGSTRVESGSATRSATARDELMRTLRDLEATATGPIQARALRWLARWSPTSRLRREDASNTP